jgi:hypothetical protein
MTEPLTQSESQALFDILVGKCFDAMSHNAIMTAWRDGRITSEKAQELLHDCGLD